MLKLSGLLLALCAAGSAQIYHPDPAAQIEKEFAFGREAGKDPDSREKRLDDSGAVEYVQKLEDRLATAAGRKPAEIRITRDGELGVTLLPGGTLYLSGGMLARVSSEAELAGLVAHALGHDPHVPRCVMSSFFLVGQMPTREEELAATRAAIETLRATGYEPTAVLELLTRLSYDRFPWGRKIVRADLLTVRAEVENEIPPAGGFAADSSEFREMHHRVLVELGMTPAKPPSLERPVLPRRSY
jgi:hypothetical protein